MALCLLQTPFKCTTQRVNLNVYIFLNGRMGVPGLKTESDKRINYVQYIEPLH